MIPRLSTPDLIGLQQSAETMLTLAGWLGLVLVVGWLGYVLVSPVAPRPVGGVWRRTPSGHAACPGCAEVMAGDTLPLLPLGQGMPVQPLEKCGSCQAFRAEETPHEA